MKDHPTVRRYYELTATAAPPTSRVLEADWLRQVCRESGADDFGFVSLDRPELDDERGDILQAFPGTRTLISIVCKMNREPIRNPFRSVANLEFHQTTDHANEVAREIVRRLEQRGIAALNPASGFPSEMSRFPGKIWLVSHKPVAVAAGLGQMGIHRNVIHPQFGNFIILGTVLMSAEVDTESQPIEFNPCLSCKLCVAACPVGAIKADGQFDFSACLTHNYREFMNGFTDWVETVADSPSALAYRQRVTDQESASVWQSLAYGPNYKAAYCLAVCPAGEDVIAPFLTDRGAFSDSTLRPLQQKLEMIYVVPHSDAEEHVSRRFPHKTLKHVNGIRPSSIAGFIAGMRHIFQPGQAKGLDAVYHFSFTGSEHRELTVTIRDQRLTVEEGLVGTATCAIEADAATWLGFLRKERNIVWAILLRRIRVKGGISWLTRFGKCFPS